MLITCTILFAALILEGLSYLGEDPFGVLPKFVQLAEGREQSSDSREGRANKVFNVAVMGLDEEERRSDTLIVMNFNTTNGGMNILSIPRDTRVYVNGNASKINALIGMQGEPLVCSQVEKMTGITVDHYITMDFKGFRQLVDALDGVNINVKTEMDYDDAEQNLHIHLSKGLQHLNGAQAEQYVRYRKGNGSEAGYAGGDLDRVRVQQDFIQAFLQQKLKLKYLSKTKEIFHILKQYVHTNIELGDLDTLITGMQKLKAEDIKGYMLPGEPAYMYNLWYFIQDAQKTQALIQNKFYFDDPLTRGQQPS